MRNLKQTHLRCFAAVAELGSVTGAARQLHRSASAVSMTVTNLENQLGQALFEPETKSRLTPFGHYVYMVATEQLGRFDHAIAGIAAYARNDIGRVDIAAMPSYASRYLPNILAEFIDKHPKIELSISDNSSAQIRRMIEQGEIDFGIASLTESETNSDFKPLLADPVGLVCSRDHRLAGISKPIDWLQIDSETFIANGTCHLIDAEDFLPILNGAEIFVQNTTSLLALIAAGVGISTLPKLAVPPEREDVVFKEFNHPNLVRTLGIVTPENRTLSPAAKACIQSILAKGQY